MDEAVSSDAAEVLAHWHDAERELLEVIKGSPEAARLTDELRRLHVEYQALIHEALSLQRRSRSEAARRR